jgi:hypothetical protein
VFQSLANGQTLFAGASIVNETVVLLPTTSPASEW